MENKFLTEVFKKLAANLNLPYYQAERRIDIFINVFLEDIVRQHTRFKDAEFILAEFPLKKNDKSDHSAHIDYLMYSPQEKKLLLVELKTDEKSFDIKQVEFYESKSKFIDWYNDFDKIKMKGFKHKKKFAKELLSEKLENDFENYSCEVIVIKPLAPKEKHNKEGRHFIALKDIEITTEFADEWKKFKQIILSKLLE